MHQYLDSDGSGTSDICVSATIGAERLQAATNWLKQTGLKGFLGEIGSGSNNNCVSAVKGALCSMQQSGVWIGIAWWSAGPWWGTVSTHLASVSRIECQAKYYETNFLSLNFAVLPIFGATQWSLHRSYSS